MSITDFTTILDDRDSDERERLADQLREEGYTFGEIEPPEYMIPSVLVSFQNNPPSGAWSDAYQMTEPGGRRFAVFCDGSGIVRKVASLASGAGRRRVRDDLAAAVFCATI